MTIEDVIKKSILPLAFMVFWFWMTKTIMKVSGQTDWFWWIFIAGLPFGIHKMRLILILCLKLRKGILNNYEKRHVNVKLRAVFIF